MSVLSARGLIRTYHDGERELPILRGVDLELERGETIAVLGRSGTGKSTLLHLLGLLDRPDGGTLRLLDEEAAALDERGRTRLRRRGIGFVFQHFHLVAELTALENVALGAAVAVGGGFGRHAARARELLAAVGLADRATHPPARLSGGERQRVAIARALSARPPLLLCDEPTGNLDPATGREVLDVLAAAAAGEGAAVILVTHDEAVAARAGRALRLEDGRLGPA